VSERDLVYLLDLEPDLATRLREDDRAEAREHLALPVVELPAGAWSLSDEGQDTRPFGLIVVDGLLLQEVHLGERSSDHLIGRGDVVLPHRPVDATLRAEPKLIVAMPSRVALLDDRLQAPFALWPGLALGLMEQAGRQLTRAAVLAAIAQLPRVEDRLEAVFWDLADRWGHVTPSGIHVPLRLTHETLARLVGGRRPTISLALTQLAARGVVSRRDDGTWLVTAATPSLETVPAGPAAEPPPPLAVALPLAEPPVAPPALGWPPAVRDELLATARRAVAEQRAARVRLRIDAARYEETRARSRAIRAEAQRVRALRADSVLTGFTTGRPPVPAP
jgi:CRP/FNR family cyclic AMP-dependent transcriptional regulator